MLVRDYLARLDRLPFASVETILEGGPAIVLAPHPDDETLGCGGLIAGAQSIGLLVEIVILTDGSGSHPRSAAYPPQRLAALRRTESIRAARALGLPDGRLTFLDLKDAAAPHDGAAFDTTCGAIEALVRRVGARSLFVTWKHDPHCDHEAAALMAEAVSARVPGLRLWSYPIWGLHRAPDSSIDAAEPLGFCLDIVPWLAAKHRAIACHASQMTNLIDDDPDGFCFSDQTLAPFLQSAERFIRFDA